ncbi:recombinase [Clostridia bacterium]|nr:recombinase [Clostridia bacterium]
MNKSQNSYLKSAENCAIIGTLQASSPPERESIMNRQNSKITALYSRLSKDDLLTGESQSISNQKLNLERYAKEHGFANPRHYSDDGYSGVDFDRPSWQEMMTEVEAGNVGVILVRTLDRMGRNYLQTGLYRERFHERGIRLISTQDGYDSDNGEDDLVPIREIMSEWYARDTSRKVKSVLHAKGKRGEHMTNAAVYGYRKSPDDKNLWLVDNEAANVVRRVFQMTIDGKGPYQIARTFTDEKVLRPVAYIALRDGYEIADPDDKFNWGGRTVTNILDRQEYMGDTVNFRTRKVSFKSKKMVTNSPDEWQIFRDTQEPIVSREVWETAQKCRVVKRRANSTGEPNPLTGLVYCGDCGGRMWNHRGKHADKYPSQDSYACNKYSQYPPKCTMHHISTANLREIVLEAIRSVSSFVKSNEQEFLRLVREESESQTAEGAKESKRKLARDKKRVAELDKLIKGLYEDKISGALSPKRFDVLSRDYEAEQETLEAEIEEAEARLATFEADTGNAEKFIAIVRKYTDFSELSAAMLNEYISKIFVFEAEKINHRRKQRVEVHLNFIGQFNVPIDGEPTEEEPFDPVEHRREIGRNSYYRHREEILAKKAAEREQDKAAKLAATPVKTPEEIIAEEAERKARKREYQRNYQREWQRKKRAEQSPVATAA